MTSIVKHNQITNKISSKAGWIRAGEAGHVGGAKVSSAAGHADGAKVSSTAGNADGAKVSWSFL